MKGSSGGFLTTVPAASSGALPVLRLTLADGTWKSCRMAWSIHAAVTKQLRHSKNGDLTAPECGEPKGEALPVQCPMSGAS